MHPKNFYALNPFFCRKCEMHISYDMSSFDFFYYMYFQKHVDYQRHDESYLGISKNMLLLNTIQDQSPLNAFKADYVLVRTPEPLIRSPACGSLGRHNELSST